MCGSLQDLGRSWAASPCSPHPSGDTATAWARQGLFPLGGGVWVSWILSFLTLTAVIAWLSLRPQAGEGRHSSERGTPELALAGLARWGGQATERRWPSEDPPALPSEETSQGVGLERWGWGPGVTCCWPAGDPRSGPERQRERRAAVVPRGPGQPWARPAVHARQIYFLFQVENNGVTGLVHLRDAGTGPECVKGEAPGSRLWGLDISASPRPRQPLSRVGAQGAQGACCRPDLRGPSPRLGRRSSSRVRELLLRNRWSLC